MQKPPSQLRMSGKATWDQDKPLLFSIVHMSCKNFASPVSWESCGQGASAVSSMLYICVIWRSQGPCIMLWIGPEVGKLIVWQYKACSCMLPPHNCCVATLCRNASSLVTVQMKQLFTLQSQSKEVDKCTFWMGHPNGKNNFFYSHSASLSCCTTLLFLLQEMCGFPYGQC